MIDFNVVICVIDNLLVDDQPPPVRFSAKYSKPQSRYGDADDDGLTFFTFLSAYFPDQ
jgi:hypothetical protein